MKTDFVHLHVHTEYSLLDGLAKIPKITTHLQSLGMDALAITDHGALYGVVEFYKKLKKENIKPIIGMEGYITDLSLGSKPEKGKFKNYHILLLAKNKVGYQNLMKLTSIAHLTGYYYKPRIDKLTLAKYKEGLICTSACALGEIAQALIDGDYSKARKLCQEYLDIFGKDFYLELQRHEYEKFTDAAPPEIRTLLFNQVKEEKAANEGIVKLSRDLGIPIVATNDAHYIEKEDAVAQDALVCIATGKQTSDIKRLRYIDAPTFYLRSQVEMKGLFLDYPEAVKNSVKIAEECDVEITLDKWFFPKYELPPGKTADQVLEERALSGIKEKISGVSRQVSERLEYEIKVIKEKGYSTYFIIMSDVARWAKDTGIVTNTRGSAAGSLVSYALDIVDINPLDYDLPFERFLTPWRPSPPDIDFDIADDRRDEVIEFITQKFGREKVCQICTFGRMLARGAVRDTARVLGYPYSVGDRIAKAIPFGSQGFPMSIKKALKVSPDLKNMYQNDVDAQKIIDLAIQIEGNARHISVHAAGVVVAPGEITEFTPVQLDPEGKKTITQYDMDALDPNVSPGEAVGLLKFDLLGLRNLAILGSAINVVRRKRGVKDDLLHPPLNDAKTFEMLSRGDTMGVFQLSGSGMTRYLKELKPTRVEDLMAMVALYRPGPMAQIPEYIRRKNNPRLIEYFDPRMKEYLEKSYGLIVYQDDVFATAIKIAGYTWEEADKFRKAVGKKIPSEMEKQREKFIKGVVTGGLPKEKAEELFKLIEPFSGYGFNKAHAASYGLVAYKTGYLKANYPVEFMCALLTAESLDTEKVSAAISECKRIGIVVLPPDINESRVGFEIVSYKDSLEGRAIRFGLSAIKNVGTAAIEAILSSREKAKFTNFFDFLSRVDARRVNKKVLESLIKVGALSAFGARAALLAKMDVIRSKIKPIGFDNQQGLFGDEIKTFEEEMVSDVAEFTDEEIQTLERQLLGFSLSAKPVGERIVFMQGLSTHKIYEISPKESLDERVKIAAIVSEVKIVVTKKSGQEMAFVRANDDTGSLDLIVFPSIFQKNRNVLADNKALLISGRVDTRDEMPAIIVENIDTEETLKRQPNLFISIPASVDKEKLAILKKLLLEHPGSQMVTLVFGKLTLDLPVKVSWDKDLAVKIGKVLE